MKVAIAVVALMLTIGCSKYQPYGAGGRGGYREHKLASDIYEVEYIHGAFPPWGLPTDMHYGEDFRLLRGAELTLENGYQYFMVKERDRSLHYSSTFVIKMFVTQPKVDSVVFVYHAEAVQAEIRRRYGIKSD